MKVILGIFIVLICAISASPQKVKVWSDPGVDVSKYKTYGWDKAMPISNPLIYQTVVDNIDQALTAKGLRKVETSPELIITTWTYSESDLHTAYPSSAGSGAGVTTGIVISSQSWAITKGTLGVGFADSGTKATVWRGTASNTLDQGPTGNAAKDAKNVEKAVKKAVAKLFKQFPRPS